ncbi:NAD-dependent epimerase/dehydratase family protein [Nocardiopsis sp. CC223A]|uniref:NAD-dependent epimerase/dehydratase family protein n=1 Tax=Nocardiopsis sp. CC223A TaxID=3044051 RepID=UPI0027961F83|nr:NAD-dependent epimerase/dehydratase family protein [Nocardiopsis sp. CC223A]
MPHPATTADPVRLAIIGCGAVALTCHIPALAETPGVRVQALIDSDPRKARAAAALMEQQGLRPPGYVGDSLTAAIPHVEAALVCTTHASHIEVATALLRAGRHVLVEKPLTTTVSDARALIALAERSNLVASVAHVRRLFPIASWVSRILKSGDLGTLQQVRWREGAPYSWPVTSPSMFRPDLAGGGVTLEVGSHVFDLLSHWFGSSVEVLDYADDSLGGVESEALIRLRYGKVRAEVALSRLRNLGGSIEIQGTEASLRVGTGFQERYEIVPAGPGSARVGSVPIEGAASDTWTGLFAGQLSLFARAVRRGDPPLADARAGLATVAVAEECYAGEGRGRLAGPRPPAPPGLASLANHRLLVTGASGFVGSRTVRHLVSNTDANVVAMVRGYHRLAGLAALDQRRLSFVTADLDTPDGLAEAMKGCDTVLHCAFGNSGDDESRWHTTVNGSLNAFRAAKEAGVRRFVLVSTVSVYDLDSAETVTEESPMIPAVPSDLSYPQQKAAAERLLLAEPSKGMEVVVVQPTVIYGPEAPDWTIRALERIATDTDILPTGDHGVCNAVHIDDVVAALLLAAVEPAANGRRFLISSDSPTSWGRLYDTYRTMAVGIGGSAGAATGEPGSRRALPGWEQEVYAARAAVDIGLARRVLGYRPRHDLDSGMESVREWAAWWFADEPTGVEGASS